jgi:putative SOS response-associated peptidase YedK
MAPSLPRDPQLDDFTSTHDRGRLGTVLRRNPKTGERHLDKLAWGLLPYDTEDLNSAPRPLNARAETVATHPMFASAFRARRAIIPMTVYYQRGTKGGPRTTFAISRRDGQPMAVAGLWESYQWPNGQIERTYCIITTEANSVVAPINDRMPVVLEKEDWSVWLGDLPGDLLALLRTPAEDILEIKQVGYRGAQPQRNLFRT